MKYWLFRAFVLTKNNYLRAWYHLVTRWRFCNNSKHFTKHYLNEPENNVIHEETMILLLNQFLLQGRFMEAGMLSELFAMHGFLRNAFEPIEATARLGLLHRSGWRTAFGELGLRNARIHQLGLHAADIVYKNHQSDLVIWLLEITEAIEDPQHHLALANCHKMTGIDQWLKHLNHYLAAHSLNMLRCNPINSDFFWGLYTNFSSDPEHESRLDITEPLVTVCMACFNAEQFVEVAVRSILNQTHRNLELLLFNDHSSDGTLDVLQRLASEDGRIVIFDNPSNLGTYASRNQALQRARGDFFTVLDADDFALPERLEMQIRHLNENPLHIGVITHWVRMQQDGSFHFRSGWGGVYQHPAVATLMVRTREVRDTVGYWDCVRFSADTEYQHRLYKVWGRTNCPTLPVPTVIALYHENSLTNHPITGISDTGPTRQSAARLAYRENWTRWHKEGGRLYLPYPLDERKFSAPPEMLL